MSLSSHYNLTVPEVVVVDTCTYHLHKIIQYSKYLEIQPILLNTYPTLPIWLSIWNSVCYLHFIFGLGFLNRTKNCWFYFWALKVHTFFVMLTKWMIYTLMTSSGRNTASIYTVVLIQNFQETSIIYMDSQNDFMFL